MNQIIVYHGSPNQQVSPQYGLGDEKHDYGKGFYLTENLELAKEWAVCRPDERNGWVHKFSLDITDLRVLDFQVDTMCTVCIMELKGDDTMNTIRKNITLPVTAYETIND